MSEIAGGAPAPAAPSAPAPSAPQGNPGPAPAQGTSPGTQGGTSEKPSQDTPAYDAPPGWVKRDGKWVVTTKVNGEDTELDYDEAMHHVRTRESANRRWQEAARMERDMEQTLRQATSSPKAFAAFAQQLGVDPRELAEAWMADHIEDSRLSPEQRRVRDLERQLSERDERDQQAQRAQRERQTAERVQAEQQQLVSKFDASLDAQGAPKSAETRTLLRQRMAQLVQHHQANGIPTTMQRITAQAIADVRKVADGFGAVVPAAQPPIEKPRAVVPPPPPAEAQPRGRDGRWTPNPSDPKPTVDARVPGSMREMRAWRQRNPNAP